MTSLHLDQVTASYAGKPVLGPVSLHTQPGEWVVLVGQSGAGKSTLLGLIYEALRAQAAYIPQELGLVQSLSVFHNVFMGRLNRHSVFYNLANLVKPWRAEQAAVQSVLEPLDMVTKIWSSAGALSGGQKQRTAVARALYQKAAVLVADEPISALDGPMAETVIKTLADSYTTAIVALHDVELALRYGQRIVGIKDGVIALDEPSERLSTQDLHQLY